MDPTRNIRRRALIIEENEYILKDLVDLLKNNLEKYYIKYYIPEVELLKKFPPHDVILPIKKFGPRKISNFSPRVIIEYMRNRHEHMKYMIEEELIPLECYLYKYKHNEGINSYKFTNNMSLPHDIFTICYLHHLKLATKLKQNDSDLIKNVSQIMINKYKILQPDKNKKRIPTYRNAITEKIITHSFPSISLPMYHFLILKHHYKCQIFLNSLENELLKTPEIVLPLLREFFKFYVKRYLWLDIMYSSIIVRLDTYLPLAYLIAQIIKSHKMYYFAEQNKREKSLTEIYIRLRRLYYSEAFPMSLKLMLCDSWNIAHINNDNICEYASFFRNCRNYDINAIRMYNICILNDSNLQIILSKL